jgi:hypothetical protein
MFHSIIFYETWNIDIYNISMKHGISKYYILKYRNIEIIMIPTI